MTMICENCKNVIQEDSKVCTKCGAKVYKEAICPNTINDVECGASISSNESVCSNCEWSITEKAFKTDKPEAEANLLLCNAEIIVDSDFCLTDDKDISDKKIEERNEETPKEVTANCESGSNKIADNTQLTLGEKTKSDKQDKSEEFVSNSKSANDANKSENKPLSTNIHRELENDIQSYPQHVSETKKENENNSKSDLHVMANLDKSKSDAIARQATGKMINHPEEGVENQASPIISNPTQYKITDDVEREGNINARANEQDTADSYEEGEKQSANGIKLSSSEKAESESEGIIAKEANDKKSKPNSTFPLNPHESKIHQTDIKSRTEKKHVDGDSNIQEGMGSHEGSSVDQLTQIRGKKVFNIMHRHSIGCFF